MDTRPYWQEAVAGTSFPALNEDIETDVLIIGGGITGITAAWLLAREGRSVVLVERDSIASRDTAHTTAHLTYMTDTRLSDLVATFSREEAKLAWQAGAASMQLIKETVDSLAIDCDLITVPGYLVAAVGTDVQEERALLERETEMAGHFGFEVRLVDDAPVTGRPAIRFADQMEFHPLKYLHALADHAEKAGARIHEHTAVTEFHFEPQRVKAGDHFIRYDKVVIATHVPLQGSAGAWGAAMFQTKLALYSTYAIAAKIPAQAVERMIWSDTADPFLYLRMWKQGDSGMALLGGEDHKTGKETHSGTRYQALEQKLARMIPEAVVTHRWSGQVVETADGLPFIGPTDETQFVATGFSGNGLTFGTVAAMMARDWVCGQPSPWEKLFSPGRRSIRSIKDFVKENADFPVRMVTDRMKIHSGKPEDLKPGEARVMEHRHKRVAAYRDRKGYLHVVSAVCPHLGCIVAWNEAEGTWDCPCHGSRFQGDGKLIAGPAESDLKPL